MDDIPRAVVRIVLRLLVAVGTLLTSAGVTTVLLLPPVPLSSPAGGETTNETYPVESSVSPAPSLGTVCGLPPQRPVPPDFHREAAGALDATHPDMDVAFPVAAAELVDHVIVRFTTEWGGPLVQHRVTMFDGLGRTLVDEQGLTIAFAGAPVSGTYKARLTDMGVLGVEGVRATMDVHYAARGPWSPSASWAGEPREWTFHAKLGPQGDAKIPLDVEGVWPLDVKVAVHDGAATRADLRLLDEFGNALREQRVDGVGLSGAVGMWELGPGAAARAIDVHDVGGSAPSEFLFTLRVIPVASPMPEPCGGPYLHAEPATWPGI